MEPVRVAGVTVVSATLHNQEEVKRKGVLIGDTVVHPQGRRRHPRGARPGRRPARRQPARVRHAHALPRMRHGAGPGQGGRRRPALPQHPVLPGAAARAAVPPGRPRRVRHRGARLQGGIGAAGRQDHRGRGRPVRARPPTTWPASPFFLKKDGSLSANATSCCSNLEEAKLRPLWRVLVALSIRHVGPTASQALAAHSARSTPSRPPRRRRCPRWRASAPVIAESVREWFAVDWHREVVEKWRAAGVRLEEEPPPTPARARWTALTVVITGTLSDYTRDDAAGARPAKVPR